MPSKYLFLSNVEKLVTGTTIEWNNLPTLSESTRECYVSISNMAIEFSATTSLEVVLVKMNIPSINYFSSSNDSPVMRYLTTDTFEGYNPNLDPAVELLTNDNLKKIEIQLVNGSGELITNAIKSVNLTLKIDYVDQKAITQDYLSQIPMRL